MPKASVTRQIAREKQKLIEFVLDIEKYPEFIPFCIESKVYERNDIKDEIAIIADLTIGKSFFGIGMEVDSFEISDAENSAIKSCK